MEYNEYDKEAFFNQYKQMSRSTDGLKGAGEWHELQKLLPDFAGKDVLDLGCGFGWHCKYAVDRGARRALGIDLSANMLEEAKERNFSDRIEYRQCGILEYEYPREAFDVVISSLALHYIDDFAAVCRGVNRCLRPGGTFVFSAEHPIFTAYGSQDWIYGEDGKILHWPVDRYFEEGPRDAVFLGEHVVKQHKTLTTYLNGLLTHGFRIQAVVEPRPDPEMMEIPGMADELRRPMMLLVSAVRTD